MLKKGLVSKIAISCVALIGLAQATIVTITPPTTVNSGVTSWQDIKSVSYSWADADNDGLIAVGDNATFSVTMHKTNWGKHDYDALKFWVDKEVTPSSVTNVLTSTGKWDFDPTNTNATGTWLNTHNTWYTWDDTYDNYSYKPWTGGDKVFTFNYTFTTAGTYDVVQSVMCSADLAKLASPTNGAPNSNDWNAWTEKIHQTNPSYQGETEKYKITVGTQRVPEPSSISMILIGLVSLAGFAISRKRK
jgi:hypothetical protein